MKGGVGVSSGAVRWGLESYHEEAEVPTSPPPPALFGVSVLYLMGPSAVLLLSHRRCRGYRISADSASASVFRPGPPARSAPAGISTPRAAETQTSTHSPTPRLDPSLTPTSLDLRFKKLGALVPPGPATLESLPP